MLTIIKIEKSDNGGHENQTSNLNFVPDGYAVLPDMMQAENFPFGDITVAPVNGVLTVTEWKPLPIPETPPAPPAPPTEIERLRADVDFLALMGGVEL